MPVLAAVSATAVTSTPEELNILDGVTSTTAELNLLDGVTSTTTELNIVDGNTSATSTTVADADRVVFNDAGTMKQVAVTDLSAYFDDKITAMPNLVSTGALDTGSITSGFGTINTGASAITTTGLISGGSLDIDNVLINGTTIGHTDDTDLITLADGLVTVAGEISVTTLDIGGTNVTSTAAELNILDGVTSTAAELNILDGVTSTAAELNILDGVTSTAAELNILDGVTSTAAELNILDGANVTVAEVNILDGGTSASSVTLVDGDRVVVNDAGVMKQVAMSALNTYMSAGSTVAADDINVGNNSINLATTSGNITIDARDDNSDIIFKGTDGGADTTFLTIDGSAAGKATFNDEVVAAALTIDNVVINGATIGHGNDTDLMTVADGILTVAGEVQMTTLDIGGTNVTATAAELNILDGVTSTAAELNILDGVTATAAELNIIDGNTSATSTTVVDADRVVLNDAGVMKQVAMSDINTYVSAGSTVAADDINAGDAAVTITTSAGDITIDAAANDTDIIFKGTDDGVDTTFLTLDGSAAGKAIFNNQIVATSLDISGDVDIDGTLETDALSINGTAVTSTAAELNILDGVTSTAAELNILDGVTSTATELNLLDGVTSTTAELNILDGVTSTAAELNALDGITAVVGELNALDLGSTAIGTAIASKAVILDANKDYTGGRNLTISGELDAGSLDISGDADIDGTLEADAITIGGVTLAETISDTVGAMVGSNTETGIGVTYDDTDNTLDFVIGTLNQNTTGSAATLTTARTIGGVSFDGSANINLPGVNSAGNQNTSGSAATLTTARTIGGTSFDGSANIAVALATAATTLETARTIHGVSFDGSANIDLSEVISDTVGAMVGSNTETGITVTYQDADNTIDFVVGTLNQDTTGNAATATALETARTIHGVSFDGTANIDLSEVISDTVGAMVGSNTETGIAVTYEDADNTIDFALNAAQTTITSLLAADIKIGEDDETKIDFETADEIHFYAADAHQIKLVDGALVPVTDNDIDLGTSSLEFKDAFFDGTVTSDAFAGPLTGNVTGNVSGTAATVTGAAQSAITSLGTLTALTVDSVIVNGATIGHTDDTDLMTVADGVLTVAGEVSMTTLDIGGTNVTSTAAELNILDGVTSTAAELNILDGVTATAGEINLIDGGTSRGTTAVASGDGILINDAGTMRMTNVDTVSTYFSSHNVGGGNIVTTGALNSGSITSGFGNINTGSSTITTTGAVSTGTLAASTGTFSGVLKTDDTTDATSTTDGSLQTDGGLSVAKDIVAGDDIKLLSDGAVITLGANEEVYLQHVHNTGILLNGTNVIQFNDASQNIGAPSATVLDINATDEIELNATLVDINGNVEISGNLTIAGTTTQVDTVTMNAQNAVVFEGATADDHETTLTIIDPTADRTINLPNVSGTIPVLAAASTTQITSTPAELNILDGVTSTAAELNILDGVTSTAAELNLLDGSSANSVVNSKAVVYGSSGELAGTLSTAAQGNVTSLGTLTALTVDDITINGSTISDGGSLTVDVGGSITLDADDGNVKFKDASVTYGQLQNGTGSQFIMQSLVSDQDMIFKVNDGGSNVNSLVLDASAAGAATFNSTVTATTFVGAVTGNVTGNASGTAATVTGAAQSAITSLGTLTALTVDNLGVNGNTITANSGALNLTPASGSAIVLDGTINVDAGVVTGATSITSTAFVGNITGNVTGNTSGTAATVTGGAQSAITSLGTLTALTVDDITINGSTISDAGNLIFDVGGDIELNADGGDIVLKDASVTFGSFINNSSSLQINANTQDKDIIFTGNDGGSGITALTLDMSNAGRANFNNDIGLNDGRVLRLGSGDDTSIYNDGSHFNIVNTTSNHDMLFKGNDDGSNITALTLDMSAAGAATFNSTVTATGFVGPLTGNVTGNVSGSAGSATGNAATATALANARTIGGVSFDGTGNINLPGVNSAGNQNTSGSAATLTNARTIGGVSFNGSANIDLPGVNSAGNQNTSGVAATATILATARTIHGVSFNGSANIDLSETISDTVGAMFSSNTESGITATYQDGDNTIDLTVGTLNQNTTGNAATATTLATARTINGTSFNGSANITLGAGSVTHAMLAGDCIDGDNIGNDVINSEHYAAGSIDNEHIADNAINSEHYADGSIDTAHYADNSITEAKMANDAVGSAELKSVATLLILNEAGSTLRTFHCAGA